MDGMAEMKLTKFTVWFTNGDYSPEFEVVYALNEVDAVILASAKRISNGDDRTVYKVLS